MVTGFVWKYSDIVYIFDLCSDATGLRKEVNSLLKQLDEDHSFHQVTAVYLGAFNLRLLGPLVV